MGRGRKPKDIIIEDKEEKKEIKKSENKKEELVDFDKALLLYLRLKPFKRLGFSDKEAVKIAMKKRVPSLKAKMEEWKNQFDKF